MADQPADFVERAERVISLTMLYPTQAVPPCHVWVDTGSILRHGTRSETLQHRQQTGRAVSALERWSLFDFIVSRISTGTNGTPGYNL